MPRSRRRARLLWGLYACGFSRIAPGRVDRVDIQWPVWIMDASVVAVGRPFRKQGGESGRFQSAGRVLPRTQTDIWRKRSETGAKVKLVPAGGGRCRVGGGDCRHEVSEWIFGEVRDRDWVAVRMVTHTSVGCWQCGQTCGGEGAVDSIAGGGRLPSIRLAISIFVFRLLLESSP